MNKLVFKGGKKQFQQDLNSPSLLDDQIELLGCTVNTEVADSILQGEVPSGLHPDIQHFATYFSKPTSIQQLGDINQLPSLEAFICGWKQAREHTQSGLSGLHFGHFKADLGHPQTTQVNYQRLHMAIILGYSLLRCQAAIDLMITKKLKS